ncbi:hypothetical protein G6O69_37415 [Pseudenhygromyxa sp. WMMC2535]|uniref:hypothetical protein n=1 Tax=Pseudenhygromyxa sp. WMMC2535 TaxID=2712867 RepID=UPI001595C071|nr:hypothetical protein [Pseudenhygromyxa sp. WMMC2535]NVB43555.1 hypothetical protein [Pseudenhygromyxa sp. WMMC2535]
MTATGEHVNTKAIRAHFSKLYAEPALPLPELPAGWDPKTTLQITSLISNRVVWNLWDAKAGKILFKAEGDEDWLEQDALPRRAQWAEKDGFVDIMHASAYALHEAVKRAPDSVRLRVAGPWLGVLYPSDFGTG